MRRLTKRVSRHQRQVVKEEKRQSYDNQPYGSLMEELAKLVFKGTPYEWVPIGSFQYIDQASIEEFRQFLQELLHAEQRDARDCRRFQRGRDAHAHRRLFRSDPRGPDVSRPKVDLAPQKEPMKKEVD
jgi:hypothetical protein